MTRLILGALDPDPDPGLDHTAGPGPGARAGGEAPDPLARLARALRDGGHEVVHAGRAAPEVLAAAAVQEDVALVVLAAGGPGHTPAGRDAVRAALAGVDADDIGVLAVADGADPAAVLGDVAAYDRG